MQSGVKGRIFLVGCPRSGTTLIQQILDAHPRVAIAPETFFIRRFWLKREDYGDLSQDSHYAKLIDDIISLPEFSEMQLNGDHFREEALLRKRDYATIFSLLLDLFAERRKAEIVGEKTPNHLLYIPILHHFFPKACFIHILRDPRAVVSSWRSVPWSKGSLAGDAKVWRRYMKTYIQFPSSIKSIIFAVKYEELVNNPENILKELCIFLDLEFDPSMLKHHTKEHQTINVEREPWKRNSLRPINLSSLERWRDKLSQLMVAEIEAVVWKEMRHLDYKVDSAFSLLAIGMVAGVFHRATAALIK